VIAACALRSLPPFDAAIQSGYSKRPFEPKDMPSGGLSNKKKPALLLAPAFAFNYNYKDKLIPISH
jgi:hypothetical protein